MLAKILNRDQQRPTGMGRNPWQYRKLRSWVDGKRFVARRNCDTCRHFDLMFETENERTAVAEHRDYLVRQFRRGHHDPSINGDRSTTTMRRMMRRPLLRHLKIESWQEIGRMMVLAETEAPAPHDRLQIVASATVLEIK